MNNFSCIYYLVFSLQIFEGNCDHFTPVMNILPNRPVGQYIRFHPVNFIGAMCLRVEVYGCSYN